jgi:hypothetical protein
MPTAALPTIAPILTALERTGPYPVLAWYGETSRIELSGHVLANWVIKAIGHLDAEIALQPGDLVVIDMPPHWKRLVLALAVWSLGGEVQVLDPGSTAAGSAGSIGASGPLVAAESKSAVEMKAAVESEAAVEPAGASAPVRVLITDRPDSERADDADEVLAVDPVSLAPRFSAELPALAHDWVQEVRASSDQLSVALPEWSGPQPAAGAEPDVDGESGAATSPRLLVDGDGLVTVRHVLDALLRGGGIVGPAAVVTEHQAREEGVTGPA